MLIALLAVVLGLLPGFAWLVFYLAEDPHSEPKRLVFFTFLMGIAGGLLAVFAERLWNGGLSAFSVGEFSILSLFGLALIEELVKFAGAYLSISQTPEMRDPIDPMIYMIVAALGFATLENIGTFANLTANGSLTLAALETLSFRFVGATLLHSLTSGIVGYEWSLGLAKNRPGRYLVGGFIMAMVIHTVFNYLVLYAASLTLPLLFLLLVGFFVLNDFERLRALEPGAEKS